MEEIRAKKSLGQNFLKDETVLKKIANSISTKEQDLIIEIGPGKGALTKYLKEKNSYLVCFEIDERMTNILKELEDKKTKVVYQDILKSDIKKEIKEIPYQDLYVIANIPYYITTPIIKKVLELNDLKSMSLLVQKEVGERFSSEPGHKAYGSLTVYLNYYFEITYLFDVPNTCFDPKPKVDSAVINFKRKEKNKNVKKEDTLFRLIEDSFRMKRKTLRNNLKNYNWNKIKEVLEKNSLPESVRAEEIPLEVFIEIANSLE